MDLSDEQIDRLWVDLPGGHVEIGNPASPMPMLISGGNGSGKTHLMRHYSFSLQRIRAGGHIAEAVRNDGYLGVYFLCGGLNAGRFTGKGFSDDVWRGVFSYYLELWLAQHALEVLEAFVRLVTDLDETTERNLVNSLMKCFDRPLALPSQTLSAFKSLLIDEQKAIDLAVNNCPLSARLDVVLSTSPGKLVFGAPQAFWSLFPQWRDTRIVYLIDEFENLTLDQQRYVHTLLRERQNPCTFNRVLKF